jgi:Fic family protein
MPVLKSLELCIMSNRDRLFVVQDSRKDYIMFSLQDIRTIAQECERQRSGEMSVYDLAKAVMYAHRMMVNCALTVRDIEMLGGIVEPEINAKGFRMQPVFIDGMMAGVAPDNIRWVMGSLCQAYNENLITRSELYQEFESIHPFADGNGRVGFVLYNLGNIGSSRLVKPPEYIKA